MPDPREDLFARLAAAAPPQLVADPPLQLLGSPQLFPHGDNGGHVILNSLGLPVDRTGAFPTTPFLVVSNILGTGALMILNQTVPANEAWRVHAISVWREGAGPVWNPITDGLIGIFAANGNPPTLPAFSAGSANRAPTPVIGGPVVTWLAGSKDTVAGDLIVSWSGRYVLGPGDVIVGMATAAGPDTVNLAVLFDRWPVAGTRPPL